MDPLLQVTRVQPAILVQTQYNEDSAASTVNSKQREYRNCR